MPLLKISYVETLFLAGSAEEVFGGVERLVEAVVST